MFNILNVELNSFCLICVFRDHCELCKNDYKAYVKKTDLIIYYKLIELKYIRKKYLQFFYLKYINFFKKNFGISFSTVCGCLIKVKSASVKTLN